MAMSTKNEKNLRSYEAKKTIIVNNGSVRTYNADVEYKNHKTDNDYILPNVKVISSNDISYGGFNLSVADLQDMKDAFVQVSTNFGDWTCCNGTLTVKGIDKTGIKGDYTLILK